MSSPTSARVKRQLKGWGDLVVVVLDSVTHRPHLKRYDTAHRNNVAIGWASVREMFSTTGFNLLTAPVVSRARVCN